MYIIRLYSIYHILYIIYYISYIKINETRTQYDAIPNLCGRQARGAKIAFELHSRFQTDTPAFSKLLKSATLNQEMEFKARAIPSMLEMKCMEFVMVGLVVTMKSDTINVFDQNNQLLHFSML